MIKGLHLTANMGEPMLASEKYRWIISKLLYLSLTRADITFTVQQLSQFLHLPCMDHWRAIIHLLKYLRGCSSKGIFLPVSSDFSLTTYSDIDCVACTMSR